MTDLQFAQLCTKRPDFRFEMTSAGELLPRPPNFTLTGIRNREILVQLAHWALIDGTGIVGDSSTGFVLPNGARRSPDASWISQTSIATLPPGEIQKYWHLCPAFVIELRSPTDRLRVLREKMVEYISNGAQLAWLIDPETRTVEIFRPTQQPELLENPTAISADGPVSGFELVLAKVWEPLT